MSTAIENARPMVEGWLTSACEEHHCECTDADYHFWIFKRGALGSGMIELINHPDISQGEDVCAMAIVPPLAPLASRDEAVSLLSFAEWLNGIAVVVKDFGEGGNVAFQIKLPIADLSAEKLTATWARLCDACTQLTR
ncbi:MAG: hypothetical protein Q4F99_04990 [bacterium]|nr:hypothetical protein [bacterium]